MVEMLSHQLRVDQAILTGTFFFVFLCRVLIHPKVMYVASLLLLHHLVSEISWHQPFVLMIFSKTWVK
jgi:hypothetical protein